jgi:hypothetical protein
MLRARTAHQQQLRTCAPRRERERQEKEEEEKKAQAMNVESLLRLFRSHRRR